MEVEITRVAWMCTCKNVVVYLFSKHSLVLKSTFSTKSKAHWNKDCECVPVECLKG